MSRPPEAGVPSLLAGGFAATRAALLARPWGTGDERRRALADLADEWVRGLYRSAGVPETGAALVAVGSYGRRELSPGSDLDLVLVHDSLREVDQAAARVWYPVWDEGVSLDHSVRTVGQARRVAAADLPAALGMLDARHVAGDASLTLRLRSSVLADWRAFAPRRVGDLRANARERGAQFGELAFLLEPDLKQARGGLRDVVALRAIAASWLADSPHGALETAYRDLLDVRDGLHLVSGRSSDRLTLQDQDAVADLLGYADADELLRRVCLAGRDVSYASDLAWRRVGQLLSARSRRRRILSRAGGPAPVPPRLPLADGVVAYDGEAVLARDAAVEQDPVLVLRLAAAAAQAGLPVSPGTVDRLRASGSLPVPWPSAAVRALVTLLGAGVATLPVWEGLDRAGLVDRFLPEWSTVRGLPQRNPVHRFTVDRHLVQTAVEASALARRVSRPDLLLLAALVHDLGKGAGRPGGASSSAAGPVDHAEAGAALAEQIAGRMGLPPGDVATLGVLVRNHLLLVDTATRRDLDDPATAETVAAAVGGEDVLELLQALTEADARATGPAAWTPWRVSLVGDLVARTAAALRGVSRLARPEPAAELAGLLGTAPEAVRVAHAEHSLIVSVVAPDRVGLLAVVAGALSLARLEVRSATVATMGGRAVQTWTVEPAFGRSDDDRVIIDLVRRALAGTLDVPGRLASRDAAYAGHPRMPVPAPEARVVPGASADATVLEVRAHDRPGLLATVATTLAAAGAAVRSARVDTLGAEAVDVFYLVEAGGGPPGTCLSPQRESDVCAAVRAALA
ncbi:MAG: [protein-PII] uridylyltransferase [Actinomycetes bacterium]